MVFRNILSALLRQRSKLGRMSFDDARVWLTDWVESSRPQLSSCSSMRFQEKVENLGFKYLSAGAFGKVYLSPCGRFVVKVNKYGSGDKGYGAFLELALKRQENPYYPRIYSCLNDGMNQIVLMERLESIREGSGEKHRPRAEALQRYAYKWSEIDAESDDDDLREIVADLHWLYEQPGINQDLHMGNVMHRGGHIVVTDPAT